MKRFASFVGSLALFLALVSLLVAPIAQAAGPRISGGNPSFNETAAEEEGYWYSRYNLGNLVFRSGLGGTFKPDPNIVKKMIQMVDANPGDGDTAKPPTRPALLHSVYASGDPHYIQKIDVNDFGTQRWDPASFDKTVTSRAMGWTMIKESEWAKQFHVDSHFGTPQDNFGAQWRFAGMMLNAEAKMQANYALKNLKNAQGFIANSDGTVDWPGQWVMLEALSDLSGTLAAKKLPHSQSNRYYDPNVAAMLGKAADGLFNALTSRQPASTEELSLAIQSLVWYAATTNNAANQSKAVSRIAQLGKELMSANTDTATNKAFAIRGLIEAYRTTRDRTYLNAAGQVFDRLAGEYDAEHGIFTSQNAYTIDNVAVIMGALNASRLFGENVIDTAKASDMFTGFFESAVNLSHLQQSVPPKNVAKGTFEQNEPDIFYGYPGLPKPPMAGGPYGIAPVFATEVTWDGNGWKVTNGRFDTAGAMHASNEFIWFHNDEVNGFPVVSLQAATLPVTGGPTVPWFLITALLGVLMVGTGVLWRRTPESAR